jgi:hypothetical protein
VKLTQRGADVKPRLCHGTAPNAPFGAARTNSRLSEKPPISAPCVSARSSLVAERNELLSVRTSRSVALIEDVLKEEPEAGWRLLFREDFPYQFEDIGNGVQV